MPRLRLLAYSQQTRYLTGIMSAMAGEGFEVSVTTSEAEALSKFQSGNYDLLLLNLPARDPQEAGGTLVVVRTGRNTLAVPSLAASPLICLDDRPDGVRYALGQAKALREATEASLLAPLLALAGTVSREEKAEAILSKLLEALSGLISTGVWLLSLQGPRNELAVRQTYGDQGLSQPLVLRMGRWTMEKGQPLLLLDAAAAPAEWRQEMSSGVSSGFSLPLRLEGSAMGALVCLRGAGGRFTEQQVKLASLFQPLLALLVERERQGQERRESQSSVSELQENLERRQREIRALNTLLQNQQARLLDVEEGFQSLGKRYTAMLRAAVNVRETGDPTQPGPSEEVATWMLALAEPLGLPVQGLAEMAYLHDLGMPGTPPSKEGATGQQRLLRHPFLAEQIAESLGLPLEVRLALKHHHESYDGSGYPDGLSGQSIPLGARLLRVVDAMVTLTSASDERLPPQEALARLKAGAGKEYDPQIVEALGQLVVEKSGRPEAEIISTVSHELRSPLTFLVGYSELLAAQKDLPADAKEKAQEIYHEAVHMTKLVEDLLSVSRYESGRVEFRWQEADVGELVQRSVTRAQARGSQHRWELRLPGAPLRIRTDPDKLQQVLDNLLDNAIKYSPNGGMITVSGDLRDGELLLSIADQGIGIPRDKQAHLFEKFYRVDSPLKDQVPGTGLGLNLCQHIVKAHGGRIQVESSEGKGSTFTIALPK